MQIKIDKLKIPSLYSNNNNLIEDFYYEKIDNNIDNIIYELKNYTWNNYIITWYRWAGKTTFVKFIESKVLNNKNLFVFVDYPISKWYYTLLKKIIRNLYITLDENNYINEKTKIELKSEMEELYISTFSEVSKNTILSEYITKSNSVNFEIDIYNLILYSISFIIVVFWLIFILIKSTTLAYIFIFFWITLNIISYFIKKIKSFSNLKNILKKEKKKEEKSSINIKEYYDDDISEQHLKNIIKSFKNKWINITFIIDELDKIEKEEEINEIINSIKPLLMSWISNFIVISWQSTLFQIYNWKIESDKVINSLFSREIHIPLFSKNYFQKIVKNLIIQNSNFKKDDILLIDFINHLIIKSNKNIRKFIINLKNNISWSEDENNSFIVLTKNKLYKNESKILEIIDIIETENIQYQYIWIRDYLTNQLFIWVNKIYIKWEIEFTFENIINENESHNFINQYKENIKLIWEEFFKQLVTKKILIKSKNKYKLNIEVESNPNNQDVHTVENIFFDLYRNLEKLVIELQNIYKNDVKLFNKNSITFLKQKFNIDLWNNIINLRNKIVHWEKTSEKDFIDITFYVRDLPWIIWTIIESYTFNILEEYFKKKWFESHLKNNYGKELDSNLSKNYDFKYTKDSETINIDIKYNNFEISNHFDSINKKEFYIFIFYYDYKKYNWYEKIQNLNKILKNKWIDSNVFLINNSESRWIINKWTTEAYLNTFFNKIEQNKTTNNIFEDNTILKTWYKNIDEKINIYWKEIITIASYPFEISSNFLLNIFINNFSCWKKWLFISNSLIEERMVDKICNIINLEKAIENDEEKILNIYSELWNYIIYNKLNIIELEKYIDYNINFIFIDNIQTLASSKQEYNNLFKALKEIANKYNISIIITSNLNPKKITSKFDKKPTSEDLADYSDSFINLSNSILTLYREDYYDEFTEKKWIIEVSIHKWSNSNHHSTRWLELMETKDWRVLEIEKQN